MKVEERKYNVYIAEDGKEFKTEEDCAKYELEGIEGRIGKALMHLEWKRDATIKNINKAKQLWLPNAVKQIQIKEKELRLLISDLYKNKLTGSKRTAAIHHICVKSDSLYNARKYLEDSIEDFREQKKSLKEINAQIKSHNLKLQELKKGK
jgi:uncharacterized protein (DUF3084 family)